MFHRPRPEEHGSEKQAPEQQKAEPQKPEYKKITGDRQAERPAVTKFVAKNEEITQAKEEKAMKIDTTDSRENEERSMDAPAGAPFQRPPQMQRSMPGFAAGSGYMGASHSPYESARNAERRLVIGQGITMSGEIEACDYLLVEGTLEAALKGAKVLEIADTGTFYGAVEIEEATVAGRFEGELTVNGRLTIKSGGSVTGTVSYKELAVEAGATLDGKISPLTAAGVAKAEGSKKSMAPKNDNADRVVAELPLSGNALAAE